VVEIQPQVTSCRVGGDEARGIRAPGEDLGMASAEAGDTDLAGPAPAGREGAEVDRIAAISSMGRSRK
jgi:hypothetical protein